MYFFPVLWHARLNRYTSPRTVFVFSAPWILAPVAGSAQGLAYRAWGVNTADKVESTQDGRLDENSCSALTLFFAYGIVELQGSMTSRNLYLVTT